MNDRKATGKRARGRRTYGIARWAALLGCVCAVWIADADAASALEPGDAAKDFQAPNLDGDGMVSLKDHRGKVVYLDFWASWCNPCQTAIPLIEELRGEFPADDFQVVAVNLDKSTKKAKKFLSKNPVGYPSASDPRGMLPRAFGLETMPTSYLIDRAGVIRYVHKGFRANDVDVLRAEINKLVKASPAAMR
jgi:peroxiredoxin